MRRIFIFIGLVWIGMLCMNAQSNSRFMAFRSGEKVYYNAFYNWNFVWMNAGNVSFTVDATVYNKIPSYKLTSIGTTFKNYDIFYKVRDTFVTVVDTTRLLPFIYHRKNNEGGEKTYETYRFDYAGKKIHSWVLNKDKPKPGVNTVIPMKDNALDLVSMVYKARNIDYSKYQKNDKIPIRLVVDGTIYDLYIRYLGKEIVTTRDKRSFHCIKFSPLLMEGTIFEGGEDMTVWVTDDRNRIPIVVEAKILIGSVKAMFIDAKGLRYPMEAEIGGNK